MKKIACVLTFIVTVSSVFGSVLMSDDFNSYSQGTLVPQGGWAIHSGDATQKPIQVVNSEFSVPGAGNAVVLQQGSGSGQDISKAIGSTMAAGNTWYAGFCIRVDGTSPIGYDDYVVHFKNTGTTFGGKVFVKSLAGSDYTFGFQSAGSGDDTTIVWNTGFDYGTSHRIVVEYAYDSGYGRLWVDPIIAQGANGNLFLENTGTAAIAFVGLALRQASDVTSTQMVDNLVVSTTFEEAAAVCPEPTTMLLLGLGGLLFARKK